MRFFHQCGIMLFILSLANVKKKALVFYACVCLETPPTSQIKSNMQHFLSLSANVSSHPRNFKHYHTLTESRLNDSRLKRWINNQFGIIKSKQTDTDTRHDLRIFTRIVEVGRLKAANNNMTIMVIASAIWITVSLWRHDKRNQAMVQRQRRDKLQILILDYDFLVQIRFKYRFSKKKKNSLLNEALNVTFKTSFFCLENRPAQHSLQQIACAALKNFIFNPSPSRSQ